MFVAAFRALILSYFRHERGRTLLTVLGVALGVAVLVAVDLANESAVASFRGTLRDMAGRADLTIRGNGSALPGDCVGRVARVPGVAAASPLITGHIGWSDGRTTETLTLLGADFLRGNEDGDAPIRDLKLELQEGRGGTALLTDLEALVLSAKFAEAHGLKSGDRAVFDVEGRAREMTIAGTVSAGALDDSLDGRFAVVDIGIADALLNSRGAVDRIDVVAEEGADLDALRAAISEVLPTGSIVERPAAGGARADDMLAAFRFNLRALGYVSIIVGAFLIFNTMSIAVVRRRAAIGTLRAMGLPRGAVRRAFIAEGLLFGVAGSLVGIVAGVAMAQALLGTVSDAISINFFAASATRIVPAPGLLLGAFAMGVGCSLIAALVPAAEAARTPPANTMRRGTGDGSAGHSRLRIAAGLVALAGAAAICARDPRNGLPLEGYAAAACVLVTPVLWSRAVLGWLSRVLRPLWTRMFGAEGLVAVATAQAATGRASIALSGLALSLAMSVALGVMVSSFRNTVVTWMQDVLLADYYVHAAPTGRGAPSPLLPVAFADAVARIPGVSGVDPFRSRRIVFGGREAWLGSGDFRLARFRNLAADGRPASEVLEQARLNREAIVSESFAAKHGIARGDTIAVPTPSGEVPLRVAGIYFDYSTEQGFIVIDRDLFLEFDPDERVESLSVFLADGADARTVRDAIARTAETVPGMPRLVVRSNVELRAAAVAAFDATFRVTWVLQIIAVVVAVLGVTTTLLAQILDRRHEIAALRYIGATRARVARIIILESGFVAVAGTALGAGSGLALAWVLTSVIMYQSFGWTIGFGIPWGRVAAICAIVFAATVAAGWLPAREAANLRGETRA